MGAVDAAWLHMDVPTNLMMITGVLSFDDQVDWDQLRKLVAERLVDRYPRFRQRAVEPKIPLGRPCWEDVAVDLDRHLVRTALPAGPGGARAGHQELQDLVSRLMSSPLDRTVPLWQFHLVDGGAGGSAIIARLHHCIADGISLARVLLSLGDDPVEVDIREHVAPRPAPPPATGFGRIAQIVAAVSLLVVRILTFIRVVTLPADPRTALKGQLGTAKRAAWSASVPLEDIRAVGRATDTTINDVLVAAMAGALRRYLHSHDGVVDDVRAAIPFNLRPLDQPVATTLGNQFGLVFLPMPLTRASPHERLRQVSARMDALKQSEEPTVIYAVANALGRVPPQVERAVVEILARKATLVLTNVIGPEEPMLMAGVPVTDVMFWVPQSGRVALGASILSYAGNVTVGLAVDPAVVVDPDEIVAAFAEELALLS